MDIHVSKGPGLLREINTRARGLSGRLFLDLDWVPVLREARRAIRCTGSSGYSWQSLRLCSVFTAGSGIQNRNDFKTKQRQTLLQS